MSTRLTYTSGDMTRAAEEFEVRLAETAMTAFSAGGRRDATWSALKPPHEIPNIPTAPVHQGCSASHAITSSASSISCGRYSSCRIPSESPLPRRSTRTPA